MRKHVATLLSWLAPLSSVEALFRSAFAASAERLPSLCARPPQPRMDAKQAFSVPSLPLPASLPRPLTAASPAAPAPPLHAAVRGYPAPDPHAGLSLPTPANGGPPPFLPP